MLRFPCLVKCVIKTFFGATKVVYNLPKNSGNFAWDVNGKTVLVYPNGNFPK